MKDEIFVIIPSLITTFGFITRYFWERYINKKEEIKKQKINKIEFKLKKFYYPIYFNLNKLSNLWYVSQEYKIQKEEKIIEKIEKECIQIHIDNQNIIENNIVEVNPIPKLFDSINMYYKHITINKILTNIQSKNKAKSFDADFPENFKTIIKNRIIVLENELV